MHGVQTELEEPEEDDQVPMGQPEHDEAPAEVAKLPAGHCAHAVDPLAGA
jgi:hypothetical protein